MANKGFLKDGEVILTEGYRDHLLRNVFYIPKDLKEELQSEIVESDIPQYFALGSGVLYGLSIVAHDFSKCNTCWYCDACATLSEPHMVPNICSYLTLIRSLHRGNPIPLLTSEDFDILQDKILVGGTRILGVPKRMLYNNIWRY